MQGSFQGKCLTKVCRGISQGNVQGGDQGKCAMGEGGKQECQRGSMQGKRARGCLQGVQRGKNQGGINPYPELNSNYTIHACLLTKLFSTFVPLMVK